MRIYQIDPTKDSRWQGLVREHANASVFHSVGWLQALRRSYGYEPVAFTTSPPTGDLKNGVVFCRVRSWLTGSRLVSLPFSDHCEPLCDSPDDLDFLLRYLQTTLDHQNWRYLEVRSLNQNLCSPVEPNGSNSLLRYFLHVLDIRPDLQDVFRHLDKDSVQRRIQRAEKAGLVEQAGRSEDLLRKFYDLFVITRRRHRLPPIPYRWFQNLVQCQGDAVQVRVAHQGAQPIAAILTLRFRNVLYYKYGASDKRYHHLGATPWLLWNALGAAKSTGATEFDLGRTEADNVGLLAFKDNWAKPRRELVYWRFPNTSGLDSPNGWRLKLAKQVFSFMPRKLLTFTGRLIYRHIG